MNNSSLPTLTLGLDLGDRRHTFCLIDTEARILEEASVPNSSEALAALSARFPEARIVIETGTHSPWISRLFAERGHSVIVANARKLRAISSSNNKSDQEDARMLARLGRADPQLLSPIRHRSEDGQRALVPLKVREALVRSRVNLINTTRCLLKSLGILLPASIKANAFPKKARLQLEPANCALVEPLLLSLEHLNDQIKALEQQLETLGQSQYPVTQRLQQIPGVGPITALCFVLTLENAQRFTHTRDVGAYLGLVPRRDQSGQSDKQLPITKAGNTQLRCLLVNCAHYILGPFGPPTALRETGLRLAARGGKAAKKRAVIAVARKLAVLLLSLWKTGSSYQRTPVRLSPLQLSPGATLPDHCGASLA